MVIHDRSYQRWQGDRTRPVAAVATIASGAVRAGLATLFRRKLPAILLVLASMSMFLFLLVFVFVRYYFVTHLEDLPQAREFLEDQEFQDFTMISPRLVWFYLSQAQLAFVAVTCVLVGSGMIANDRKSNALELYLSRPVSVRQYVLGKLLALGFFVALVTLVPATLLVLAQLSVSALDEVPRMLDLLWRTLVTGALVVAVPSVLMLTASSLVQRARVAAILWLAFLFITSVVLANALEDVFSEDRFYLLSFVFNLQQVAAWVLGYADGLVPGVPAWHSAVVLLGWCLLCLLLVRRKVRPVEIVA